MLKLSSILLFVGLVLVRTVTQAAENPRKIDIRSIPGANNTYYSGLESSYPSNLNLREDRKVGIGLATGGSLGLVGLNLELNFEDTESTLIGFGRGEGYDSFQIGWKHSFEGDYLSPFTSLSYSRWYNSTSTNQDHLNSSILNRVLTNQEKVDGRFGVDFLNASVGVQYNQLSGGLVGLAFYGEIIAMTEVKRSKVLPSGTVGLLYYF